MKLHTIIAVSLLSVASFITLPAASADSFKVTGVTVDDVQVKRQGDYLSLVLDFDLAALKVPSNQAVVLTPRLINGNDSIDFKSIGVYGRRRYYYYMRNGETPITGKKEESYRFDKHPDQIDYTQFVPFADWMDGAELVLVRGEYGCCHELENQEIARLSGLPKKEEPKKPSLRMVYVRPKAEANKSRSLSGSAFIDFPVDQTVIYPNYRNNTAELAKINATIDSVRGDRDITITKVWLKGFASPESPYQHNTELAIGRTKALRDYIENMYHFGHGTIETDYEPEDWEGLRRYVVASDLPHRAQILRLIDLDTDPDRKEWLIKSQYKDDYRYMLHNWYPALRHTDYRINYDIRSYSDIDEIKRIFAESPSKLSLNEFYLLAEQYEPGSRKFNDVFTTAVRVFPADPIANLNAANSEMETGDYAAAKRYLERSGNSPEAEYARGIYALAQNRLTDALDYFLKASKGGVKEADTMIWEITREK